MIVPGYNSYILLNLECAQLDKNAYIQYLEEMKKNGLITINKTAGVSNVSGSGTYKYESNVNINYEINLLFGIKLCLL